MRDVAGRAAGGDPGGRADSEWTDLSLSADGRRVTLNDRGVLVVLDTTSNRKLLEVPANSWSVPVALSGDGTRLAYLGGSGETVSTSRIADVDSGREVQFIPKASVD